MTQNHEPRGRTNWLYLPLIVSLGLAWAAALLVVLPLLAQSAPSQDVVFLIDNSPSARTGEGAPDKSPTDPDGIRLRLPRFAVGALGLITNTQNQRIGVVSFAQKNTILMPLTSVQDWSKADFGRVVSENIGTGTDFAAALNVAGQMLGDCTKDTRQCDIVIFSDGVFDNPANDSRTASNALRTLTQQGVKVTLLTFIDRYTTKLYLDSKQAWTNFKADGLLARYELSATERFKTNPAEVYGVLFGVLNATDLFRDFEYTSFPKVITREVPLFQRWARWDIVADAPIETVFRLGNQELKPIRAGNTYLFADPPAGAWQIEFKGQAAGLAYFRKSDEAAPIALNIRSLPETVTVGYDVPVVVNLTVGAGQIITQTDLFTVTMKVTGPTTYTSALTRTSVGLVGMIPANVLTTGLYAVDFPVDANARLGISVSSAKGQFAVAAQPVVVPPSIPSIDLQIGPSAVISAGQSVVLTATVSNCTGNCTPEFLIVQPGTAITVKPDIAIGGLYVKVITPTQPIAIVARLNVLGVQTAPYVIDIKTLTIPPISFPATPWFVALSGLALGLIAGIRIGYLLRNPEVRNLLENIAGLKDDNEHKSEKIDEMERENARVKEVARNVEQRVFQRNIEHEKSTEEILFRSGMAEILTSLLDPRPDGKLTKDYEEHFLNKARIAFEVLR